MEATGVNQLCKVPMVSPISRGLEEVGMESLMGSLGLAEGMFLIGI